jgi:hypothetical protein
MKKVLAALAGAVLAPTLVIVGVAVLYAPRSSENWDLATPVITLAALLPAALFGAVIGFAMVDLLAADNRKAAKWLGGSGVLLVVLIPIGIVLFPYIVGVLPRRPPTPAERRQAWAQWLRQTPPALGARLAEQLQGCLGEGDVPASGEALLAGGCKDVRSHWLGLGADKLGLLGAYTNADDGWRWDLVDSAGRRRLQVFPDPLLAQAGPTFEVERGRTLRHDPQPGPGFVRDSTLPQLARFGTCLRGWAAEWRRAGTWSGSADSLPFLLEAAWMPHADGCPGVRVETPAERPGFPWILSVRNNTGTPIRVTYNPRAGASAETPFELWLYFDRVGYMVDAEGRWHARQGGYATSVDPPPAPCLIDFSIPCE